MKQFQNLGEKIEKLWRDKNYDEEVFPAIAKENLAAENLPEKLSAWEVIEWTLEEMNLPEQQDVAGRFGDPPITVFNAPRFHIDVYFWLEGTTAIHQHSFCGAFQVLHGSSLHSSYEFKLREKLNAFTEIGRMDLKTCELLNVGDIQEISAGQRYIHSLFHLEQPSATIVVRTHRSPLFLPQFSYHKPGLAVDPFFEEPNTAKKIQTITALIRSEHPATDDFIKKLLQKSDFQTCFKILSAIRPFLQQGQMQETFNLTEPKRRFENFLEIVAETHENFADLLPEVFQYKEKLEQIVQQRGFVKDPEHRFFLALLLNVDGKNKIFDLIKSKFPDEQPLDKILDWVFDLANTKVLGINIPNALGVESFDDFDLIVLENLLQNKSDEETIEIVKNDLSGENTADIDKNILSRIEKIRNAVIFEALLK